MQARGVWRWRWVAWVAMGACLVPVDSARGDDESTELVVVVGQSTGIEDIRSEDLRRLFMGEIVRDPGSDTPLIPLNQPPQSAARSTFDRLILGMSPSDMSRFWIDRKVRGERSAPRSIAPPGNLARVVAKFRGTIAYLNPRDVSPGLKIVRIDGRLPGENGYALPRPKRP